MEVFRAEEEAGVAREVADRAAAVGGSQRSAPRRAGVLEEAEGAACGSRTRERAARLGEEAVLRAVAVACVKSKFQTKVLPHCLIFTRAAAVDPGQRTRAQEARPAEEEAAAAQRRRVDRERRAAAGPAVRPRL